MQLRLLSINTWWILLVKSLQATQEQNFMFCLQSNLSSEWGFLCSGKIALIPLIELLVFLRLWSLGTRNQYLCCDPPPTSTDLILKHTTDICSNTRQIDLIYTFNLFSSLKLNKNTDEKFNHFYKNRFELCVINYNNVWFSFVWAEPVCVACLNQIYIITTLWSGSCSFYDCQQIV